MTSSLTATAYLSVEFSVSLSHIRCLPTVELHMSLYINAGFILESRLEFTATDCHFNYRSNFVYIAYKLRIQKYPC